MEFIIDSFLIQNVSQRFQRYIYFACHQNGPSSTPRVAIISIPVDPGDHAPGSIVLGHVMGGGGAKVGVRDYEVTRLRRGLPETGWRFPRRRSPLQRPITRKTSILTQSTHGEYFIRDSGIFPSNFAAIPLHPATMPRKIRVKTSENVNWSEPPPSSARGKQVREGGRREDSMARMHTATSKGRERERERETSRRETLTWFTLASVRSAGKFENSFVQPFGPPYGR